jgi:ABC-type transport system substrate-binding protein
MHKQLVLPVVIAAIGASLLVSTALASSSSSSATRGGTLRANHSLSDFEFMDPQKCYDTGCYEALWPTTYQLIQYPEKSGEESKRFYAEGATGFPVVSKDGKTYTFTVRSGIKASNGKTVTAAWYKRAFERLLSPKSGDAASSRAGAVGILADIQGVQAFYDGKAANLTGVVASGQKLTIKLTRANPALISIMAMPWFTATDPATPYSEEGVDVLPTAGPYRVQAREINRSVVLIRNTSYKGTRPANPDRIVITVNTDQAQSLLQVRSGQADIDIIPPPSAAMAELGESYGVNKQRFFVKPTASTFWWALSNAGPLANVNWRKAINFAIDRPAQLRIAGKYAGARTDQILPPSMPGFKPADIYPVKGANPTRAKALAGNTSAAPEIRIVHSNSQANINRGQVMRFNLEQMGFKAKTEAIPSSQLFSRAGDRKNGNYDLMCLGWQQDYPDPSNFINVLFDGRNIPAEGSSTNWSFFNSTKFNNLMTQASRLSGQARLNAYGNLDVQMMREGAPVAPLFNSNNRILISQRLRNFQYNAATTITALNAFTITGG